METHKRILSILYLISGALYLLFGILALSIISTLFPVIIEEAGKDAWVLTFIMQFANYIIGAILIFLVVPSFIGAIGVMTDKKWGMTLLLVLGCLKLFNFPVGTALGIYTIWVYVEDQKK